MARPTAETLPHGVDLHRLDPHHDHRGRFAELFRDSWPVGIRPVQWNLMESHAGMLRGVHVHPRHDDYLVQLDGRCDLGLRDLRQGSPTEGLAVVLPLDGEGLPAVVIPHGVAHGLFFPSASIQLLGVSHEWDTDDELGCRYDDPELELDWETGEPPLSARDAALPSLRGLLEQLRPHQPLA